MCGVFGFITKNGNGPDLARLRRIAVETQQRGNHAFGLAWLDPQGDIHTFKRPGPATANLGGLAGCRDATVVIGHCRWATHGSPKVNRNNHPHQAGRGWFVHNGVVRNYDDLVEQYHLSPRTQCDSEVLGLLMARFPGPLGLRAIRMTELVEGPLAMLGLWRKPARLLIVRDGNPLCFGETNGGFYFGSLPDELPGQVMSIMDEYSGMLTYTKDGIRHGAFRRRSASYRS